MMTPLELLRVQIAAMPSSTTASHGGTTTPALLDFEGAPFGDEGAAQIGGEIITLRYPYHDLPGLAPGETITVGGASYLVSAGPRRIGDGLEAVVLLEEA